MRKESEALFTKIIYKISLHNDNGKNWVQKYEIIFSFSVYFIHKYCKYVDNNFKLFSFVCMNFVVYPGDLHCES